MLIYGLNDYYFKVPIVDKQSSNNYRYLFRVEKIEATRKISGENYCKDQGYYSKENNCYNLKKNYIISTTRKLSKDIYKKTLTCSRNYTTYNDKFHIIENRTLNGKIINVWA